MLTLLLLLSLLCNSIAVVIRITKINMYPLRMNILISGLLKTLWLKLARQQIKSICHDYSNVL